MSMTPFDGGLLPEGGDLKAFADSQAFKVLDMWCRQHPMPCGLIAGPKGLGKTTLIEYYFVDERRRRLAAEKKNLIQLCHFTGSQLRSDTEVFLTLIEAVRASLDCLQRDAEQTVRLRTAFDEIRQKPEYADVETNPRKGRLLLEELTRLLRQSGYGVSLVIDDFQQLTCSETCAENTFSAMANLTQKNLISYIVVTDYPIQTGSQNYVISSFARIYPDALIPAGVTGKKAAAALQSAVRTMLAEWQEDEDDPIVFTDDELAGIWTLTDGVPGLLQCALKALYEYRQANRAELTWEMLQDVVLTGCRELMQQWTKHLDESYWKTFNVILDGCDDNAITQRLSKEDDRRAELRVSGLVRRNASTKQWNAICPLFEQYLRQELDRPKSQLDDLAQYMKLMKKYGGNGMIFNIELHQPGEQVFAGDYISAGGVKNEQHVHAGLVSAEDFLGKLGLGGLLQGGMPALNALGEKEKYDQYKLLSGRLHLSGQEAPPPGESGGQLDEEENDRRLDLLMAKAQNEILPDIDPASIENAHLDNMDESFAQVRSRMHLDEELADSLLDSLSPLCRFYVKAALIVEDHMESIMPMLQDYSTHLVMYGKCLEQSLRDSLFALLKTHRYFCDYNTYTRSNTPGDKATFGAMESETQAMLGTFCSMLSKRNRQLSELCAQNRIVVPGVVDRPMNAYQWSDWWRQFTQKVRSAKDIRNRVHAGGSSPVKQDLDELRRDTFGMDGILHWSQVGRALSEKLGIAAGGSALQRA